jgi:hypothetical protein
MHTDFQSKVIALLESKNTWNSTVLKARTLWVFNSTPLSAQEKQVEGGILNTFVTGFVQYLVSSNLSWATAAEVVVMYNQAVSNSLPFDLEN